MQATSMKGEVDGSQWKQFLDEFSKRNKGRPTRIEVIGENIGAQESEKYLPLIGVTFEPKGSAAGSVEILLGGSTPADARHLEHLILGVRSIVPITGVVGLEDGLGIEDGEGERTLMLFETPAELSEGV